MRPTKFLLCVLGSMLLTAFTPMGGWATISVDSYPTRVAVNRPIPLAFLIKQHGVKPMVGLKPTVQAVAEGQDTVIVKAKATKDDGRYSAVLRLPKTAEWTVTVIAGFHESKTVLSPIQALDAKDVAQAVGN